MSRNPIGPIPTERNQLAESKELETTLCTRCFNILQLEPFWGECGNEA